MNAAAAAFVLAPALALGSFLNVVAVRVPARRSVVRPPSSCGSCGHEIGWRDNIPVLSYLLLRGRCRHCSARISPVYPLVEVTTAALVVACVAVFGPTPYGALAAGFCALLVTLSVIDARYRIVPNRLVLPAAAGTLVVHTALDPSVEWLLGALGGSVFLFVAVLAYPKGLGMGDVKLALPHWRSSYAARRPRARWLFRSFPFSPSERWSRWSPGGSSSMRTSHSSEGWGGQGPDGECR
jgi:leader peptidase (prepilin peptidase) / N-methyltransferase